MKFVEETEGTWTAIQLKAVEMEIEQQKRDWEANRMAAMQQEELERAKVEQEDNELLTFSREDALNKVNISRSNKKKLENKRDRIVRASENQNHSVKNQSKVINSNNNSFTRNGLVNETLEQNSKNNKSGESSKSPKQRSIEIRVSNNSSTINRRYTRNLVNKSQTDDVNSNSTPRALRRRIKSNSIKSSRSNSLNSHRSNEKARSTSESTTTTDKESTTQRTTPDDSDSDVSLDVMIDSNDVNDSDSNSTNNHQQNVVRTVNLNFDSTSQDDDTIMNDVSNDLTPQKGADHNVNSDSIKMTSSPRTRSRGTVKINLWTLDESPILPANKRHKSNNQSIQKNSSLNDTLTDAEISLKADFGIVKELKVEVDLYVPKSGSKKQTTIIKKITPKRQLNVKNNHTLDSWLTKTPNSISPSVTAKKITPLLPVDPLAIDDTVTVKHETDVKPILRSRRNTTVINYSDTNKTL